MKKVFFIFVVFATLRAYAYDFPLSCPDGYATIEERLIILSDAACPSGYTTINVSNSEMLGSCLTDHMGICLMYIPSHTSYSDDTGWFEYTQLCPLE